MDKGLEFIKTTDWEYKEGSGNQLVVKICPFCSDDRWKFYMNKENGLFDCKICGKAGNLYQLKAKTTGLNDNITSFKQLFAGKKELSLDMNKEYIDELWNNREALVYLKARGFNKDTIEFFQLGLDDDWLMIPHFQDKKLWNYKMRNFKKKDFRRVAGQPSILYNIDNVDLNRKKLLIVESETDCIAAWQLGIKNVVGLTTGASTFSPEWVSYTIQFDEVYICLNSDEAGQKGAYKIAEKIGLSKCKNVILPTNDINDFLKESTSEEFKALIKDAKQFSVKDITHMSERLENLEQWLEEEGSITGIQLPFESLNSHIRGFKDEDFIVLSGDTGVGKTTMGLNIMLNFLKTGKRCLAIMLEGKIDYYIMRMMSAALDKPTLLLADVEKGKELRSEMIPEFMNYDLYLYSGQQSGMNVEKLSEIIDIATNLYDIDFVFIDNLQQFIKDDQYATQNVSRAISILKDLTVDLKVPIFLITHIRKPSNDATRRVSMHDAKQSSSIYQFADIYLTIWNDRDIHSKTAKDKMIVTIDKNRMGPGHIDVEIGYSAESGLFYEKIIDTKETKSIDEELEDDEMIFEE